MAFGFLTVISFQGKRKKKGKGKCRKKVEGKTF